MSKRITTHCPGIFPCHHPWTGTQHCLRHREEDDKPDGCGCVNDHTGCLYNDGHNACGHPAPPPPEGGYDSPLRKKETK